MTAADVAGFHAPPRTMLRAWGIAFAASLALYAATAELGPQWQDSGWQQVRILTGDLAHPMGLALTHPLHFHLCRAALLIPIGEPAARITMVSSLAAAIAVANLTAIVLSLTACRRSAMFSAATLALSHTFWQHATHTESYTLVAALLTAEWLALCAFARSGNGGWLIAVMLANGLGVANHMLAALATPVDLLILGLALYRNRVSWRIALLALAAWIAGVMPYAALIAATATASGDWSAALASAFVGKYARDVFNVATPMRSLLLAAGFVLYNLPGLAIPLAVLGCIRPAPARPPLRVLRWLLVIYALFVVRYSIADQYTYFFVVYLLVAVLAGVGLAHAMRSLAPRRAGALFVASLATALWTPALYVAAATVMADAAILTSMVGDRPYRDGVREFLLPWGDRGHARRLSDAAFALAGDDGLILIEGEAMVQHALRYDVIIGRAPRGVDVVRINDLKSVGGAHEPIRAALASGRRVVLIPVNRKRPLTALAEFAWVRRGDLYTVSTGATTLPATSTAAQ